MVERNELTAHLEKVREKSGAQLFEWVWYGDKATIDSQIDIEALMTLFSACTNYLAARSSNIRVFNGIDISERGWLATLNQDDEKKICQALL